MAEAKISLRIEGFKEAQEAVNRLKESLLELGQIAGNLQLPPNLPSDGGSFTPPSPAGAPPSVTPTAPPKGSVRADSPPPPPADATAAAAVGPPTFDEDVDPSASSRRRRGSRSRAQAPPRGSVTADSTAVDGDPYATLMGGPSPSDPYATLMGSPASGQVPGQPAPRRARRASAGGQAPPRGSASASATPPPPTTDDGAVQNQPGPGAPDGPSPPQPPAGSADSSPDADGAATPAVVPGSKSAKAQADAAAKAQAAKDQARFRAKVQVAAIAIQTALEVTRSQVDAYAAYTYGQRFDPNQAALKAVTPFLSGVGSAAGAVAGAVLGGAAGAAAGIKSGPGALISGIIGALGGAALGASLGGNIEGYVAPHLEMQFRRLLVQQIYGQGINASRDALLYLESGAANPFVLPPRTVQALDPILPLGRQANVLEMIQNLVADPANAQKFGGSAELARLIEDPKKLKEFLDSLPPGEGIGVVRAMRERQAQLHEERLKRVVLNQFPLIRDILDAIPFIDHFVPRSLDKIDADLEKLYQAQPELRKIEDEASQMRELGLQLGQSERRLGVESARLGYAMTYGTLREQITLRGRRIAEIDKQIEILQRQLDMFGENKQHDMALAIQAQMDVLRTQRMSLEQEQFMQTGGTISMMEAARARARALTGERLRPQDYIDRLRFAREKEQRFRGTPLGEAARVERMELQRSMEEQFVMDQRADVSLQVAKIGAETAVARLVGSFEERATAVFSGQERQLAAELAQVNRELRERKNLLYSERKELEARKATIEGQIAALKITGAVARSLGRVQTFMAEAIIGGEETQLALMMGLDPREAAEVLGKQAERVKAKRDEAARHLQRLREMGRKEDDVDVQQARELYAKSQVEYEIALGRQAMLHRSPMTVADSNRRAFIMQAAASGYLGQMDARQAALEEIQQIEKEMRAHAENRRRMEEKGEFKSEYVRAEWERSQLELERRLLAARIAYDDGWLDRLISQAFNSSERGTFVANTFFGRRQAAGAYPGVRALGSIGPAEGYMLMGPARTLQVPGIGSPQGMLEEGLRQTHQLDIVVRTEGGEILGGGRKSLDGTASVIMLNRPLETALQGKQL